jgi:transketolase
VIHDKATYEFKPYQAEVMREGTDITLVATGETVYYALVAAERLAREKGIQAEVLNYVFIKPFDHQTLVKSVQKTGLAITVESHQIIGGLGGAVCEALAEHHPAPVKRLGTQDRFGQSGTQEDLFKEYGIDADAIYNAALSFLGK